MGVCLSCTSANTPLTTEAANTGSVGLNPSALSLTCRSSFKASRKTSGNDETFHPPDLRERSNHQLIHCEKRNIAYAFAKHPPIPTANSITGPRSIIKLLTILGLMMIRDGRVTPAERTCIPRTILVNWLLATLSFDYRVASPIGVYSWRDHFHLRLPSSLVGCRGPYHD